MMDCFCDCKNVEMGSYDACITVLLPWNNKPANIDICVLPEVFALWRHGIRTVESCCGHGKASGYIAVEDKFIEQMEALGYVRDINAPHVFQKRGASAVLCNQSALPGLMRITVVTGFAGGQYRIEYKCDTCWHENHVAGFGDASYKRNFAETRECVKCAATHQANTEQS